MQQQNRLARIRFIHNSVPRTNATTRLNILTYLSGVLPTDKLNETPDNVNVRYDALSDEMLEGVVKIIQQYLYTES